MRVKLVGDDPTHGASALLTGRADLQQVFLAPGRYQAFLQSVTDNSQGLTTVEVKPQGPDARPQTLSLVLDNRAAPVKVSGPRETDDSIFKSDDGPAATFPFRIGLSMKVGASGEAAAPDPDSWRAPDNLDVKRLRDPAPAFEIRRRPNWSTNPRIRLTLDRGRGPALRMPIPLFADGVRCRLTLSDGQLKVNVQPINPRTALLLASLTRLFPEEQAQVVFQDGADGTKPIDMLASKMKDPWAAAVAALVLVRNADPSRVAQWIFNLGAFFPWLVDGLVAGAWTTAATAIGKASAREDQTLAILLRARALGTPYFAASNLMALELLSSLAGGAARKATRAKAEAERQIWTKRARLAIKAGPYLAWEVSEDLGVMAPPAFGLAGVGAYDLDDGTIAWT